MAVTIGLGASMFTIWDTVSGTTLPLDEGNRVVAIQPFDKAAQRVHRTTPLTDFRRWRVGFRFPVNQRLWIPLRTNPVGRVHSSADAFIFARLVPGATLERAQAEVTTFGLLPRDIAAGTSAQLEPRAVPYAAGMFPTVNRNSWLAGVIFLVGALLLMPPCANIAILVYARTVTRRDEFAARTALGASRGRIVMQLFVEVLVLAAGAGIGGFLLARQFSGQLASMVMPALGPRPFWMDFTPSLATVLCVAGLSVLAAAVAGAAPAFRATGRWQRAGFVALGHRGNGPRLGKTWTALVATQVALSLAVLPSAIEMLWGVFRPAIVGPGLPVEEFLTASLGMAGEASRFESLRIETVRRLTSEAGISGVTASAVALWDEPVVDMEVEGSEAQGAQTGFNSVDARFFEVFGIHFLAGRSFDASDFGPGRKAVIVNRSFVTEFVGEANALGRRFRYHGTGGLAAAPPGWHDIVGVVEDFPVSNDDPVVFHPMRVAPHPVSLTIRAPTGIGPAAGRLRDVARGLDPQLRVGHLQSLEEMYWQRRSFDHMFGFSLGAVMVIVLLFSMAGIYTLMAFIVAQRWREIASARRWGAQPRRLLIGIFGRAAVPLLIGAILGCAIAVRLDSYLPIAEAGGLRIPGVVAASAALMIVVGLLAVAGPARRAIRIDPIEALRFN